MNVENLAQPTPMIETGKIIKLPLASNQNQVITIDCIKGVIYQMRGVQVMLDSDLARLYHVETRVLNQAVKRNINRFPEQFMFQLTENELTTLKSQITAQSMSSQFVMTYPGKRPNKVLPFVFTELGITQLSAVLRSDLAVNVSIRINEAFHAMRHFITANSGLFQRVENLERYRIEIDKKIDDVLDCLEDGTLKEKGHIFSAGQVYNAKAFITELIGKARKKVVLVDGYISSVSIDLLDARAKGVSGTIYTGCIEPTLSTLLKNHNVEYPHKKLDVKKWKNPQHDRWLIIDDELWHCGASIKDAGVKTFGIDPIGLDANIILMQI